MSAAKDKKKKKLNESCPCKYAEVEPCKSSCSCANPVMSGGCARCCSYGSYSQRMGKAVVLANIIDNWHKHQHFMDMFDGEEEK